MIHFKASYESRLPPGPSAEDFGGSAGGIAQKRNAAYTFSQNAWSSESEVVTFTGRH